MSDDPKDTVFAGGIPAFYERYMVPLIFAPYAKDIAARVAARRPTTVLEVAAGTGVVTRELARALPMTTTIVATDLNAAMIEHAATIPIDRPVQWRVADAMSLPFEDGTFDLVVCQFGVMFFPDRPRAYAEARRVLRPDGAFLFNAWDAIEENDFPAVVTDALAAFFPQDPPRFLARTPHGYHSTSRIAEDLAAGGFHRPAEIETIDATSRASAQEAAIAFCQGTPLRNEIEARGEGLLGAATDQAARALAARFGDGLIEGRIRAHVVLAT